MQDIFLRTRMILGDDAMDRLANCHVAVFGLGGVGSYAVEALAKYYDPDHREEFFTPPYEFIIAAIDLVSCKLDLISQAQSRGIPIISALGTGNKLDPTRLCISDISKTSGCPLARVMRRELKARGIRHLPVVFSPEEAAETRQLDTPDPGRRSVPASVAGVPSCAGLMLGGYVVQALCKEKEAEQ